MPPVMLACFRRRRRYNQPEVSQAETTTHENVLTAEPPPLPGVEYFADRHFSKGSDLCSTEQPIHESSSLRLLLFPHCKAEVRRSPGTGRAARLAVITRRPFLNPLSVFSFFSVDVFLSGGGM